MQFKFAILEILAKRPEGRASIDEVWREWQEAAESQDLASRFSDYEDVDLLEAGLVVFDHKSLQITDAGRSVLRALEVFGNQSTDSRHPDQTQSLQVIDHLIGTEQRMKIFDLRLRAPGEIIDLAPPEKPEPPEAEPTQTETDTNVEETKLITSQISSETAEIRDHGRPSEIDAPRWPNAPSFLKKDFGSRIRMPARWARRTTKLAAALTSQFERLSHILRGHLAEGSSSIKTNGRPAGISGALLAVLSVVVILIGAGLFIGVNQIKTLKSEITALERQLVPLKKQAANVDQREKANNAEPKKQPQNQSSNPASMEENGKSVVDNRATPAGLALSSDEVRLIREYIKPAPFSGPAAPPINVGDPITVATIPLPSPLTDKVPKLLGGRFSIRNGAIIILKRDSHQADAVLAPN